MPISKVLARVTYKQWFIVMAGITALLALGLPPDPAELAQLKTNATSYRLAILILLVPYMVIWFFGFYAFGRLRNYYRFIRRANEGNGFARLKIGMGILAFGLVIPTMVSLILGSVAVNNPDIEHLSTIIPNYLTILTALVAFSYMSSGAWLLNAQVKARPRLNDIRLLMALFIIVGVSFCYLTLRNFFANDINPYHLNLGLLIFTYIVPYLYTWFVGLIAGLELLLYSKTVSGKLYKQSLRRLAIGMLVAIAGSIAIQFVGGALANYEGISLGFILLVNYGLVSIVAVGLVLMGLGTRNLEKIEEV